MDRGTCLVAGVGGRPGSESGISNETGIRWLGGSTSQTGVWTGGKGDEGGDGSNDGGDSNRTRFEQF
jgi:hypothetical protein